MKAGLLLAALVTLAGVLLAHYRFDVPAVLRDAAANAGPGERLLAPGARFGDGPHRLEFVSQLLTVVLGNAALPYLCVHFLAVPNARHARRAVSWAIWLTTPYYLLIILIGFGAAAQIGPQRIASAPGGQLAAVRLLALELGGLPLLTFVASAVITTTVAVTAGLVITAAASFARDIYPTVIRTGPVPDERREITVARHAVVVLCVLVTGCAILLMNQNVEFLLSLGLTLAASSILPALLFSWFWRGFTTAGALWSMYAGAAVTVVLTVFSSAVSGDPLALFPGADFAYFPWRHVGLVSIPLAFVLGYVGAKVSAGTGEDARYAEMEVRALTGAGAAEAATGAAAESLPRDPDPGRDSRPRSSA
jgi:cation/acetate symporter